MFYAHANLMLVMAGCCLRYLRDYEHLIHLIVLNQLSSLSESIILTLKV